VDLTEAGRRLFPRIDPVFRDFDTLLGELRREDVGPVHLAASAFTANNYLPALIDKFARQFPRVSLHVHVCEPGEVVHSVEAGMADFGICSLRVTPAHAEVRARARLHVALVAPDGHRITR
jgi:LysR family cys regulon transcriptional activator